jgi:hypothetical protein
MPGAARMAIGIINGHAYTQRPDDETARTNINTLNATKEY